MGFIDVNNPSKKQRMILGKIGYDLQTFKEASVRNHYGKTHTMHWELEMYGIDEEMIREFFHNTNISGYAVGDGRMFKFHNNIFTETIFEYSEDDDWCENLDKAYIEFIKEDN